MQCKKIGYEVQRLEVTLMPNESFFAERGALVYSEDGVDKTIEMNGGGVGGVVRSKLSGESIFIIQFVNRSNSPRKILLSSQRFAIPAGILPLKLNNEAIICGLGAYIASTNKVCLGLKISITSVLGGLGFLQKIKGTGTVFLSTQGLPIEVNLTAGQRMEVDEKHIIAIQGLSDGQLSEKWSFQNIIGGEGVSLIGVTGPGKMFLH